VIIHGNYQLSGQKYKSLYVLKCTTVRGLEFSPTVSNTERPNYEGWNFNCGNYLFTTDTK